MSEIVYENIVELPAESWPGVNVRVWFGRQSFTGPTSEHHQRVLTEAFDQLSRCRCEDEPFEIAKRLLHIFKIHRPEEQVNAIEVRIGTSGSIIYPEWP